MYPVANSGSDGGVDLDEEFFADQGKFPGSSVLAQLKGKAADRRAVNIWSRIRCGRLGCSAHGLGLYQDRKAHRESPRWA